MNMDEQTELMTGMLKNGEGTGKWFLPTVASQPLDLSKVEADRKWENKDDLSIMDKIQIPKDLLDSRLGTPRSIERLRVRH